MQRRDACDIPRHLTFGNHTHRTATVKRSKMEVGDKSFKNEVGKLLSNIKINPTN